MNLSLPKPDCTWISVGKEFDSYTDMCHTLRVEPGRGNSLAAQKRLFSRYFAYQKTDGRKVMITEVYDQPLPEGLSLYGSDGIGKGKYIRYIEPLLKRFVSRRIDNIETFDNSGVDSIDSSSNTNDAVNSVSEDPRGNAVCTGFSCKSCYFTKSDLLMRLGFMNGDFFKKDRVLRKRKDIMLFKPSKSRPDVSVLKAEDIGDRLIITIDDLYFFENMCLLIYEKWRSAVRAINNHGVVFCESIYTLPCVDGITETDTLQTSFVKQAEANALADLKLETIRQVFTKYNYKLFCLKRNAELGKIMNSSDVTISEGIKITLNDSLIDRVSDSSDKVPDDELRFMINQMIVKDFHKRIRCYKEQYDKEHTCDSEDCDEGIWDSVTADNTEIGDKKSVVKIGDNGGADSGILSAISGDETDSGNVDNVYNDSADSPNNVKDSAVINTNNVNGFDIGSNGSGKNSKNTSYLRDRVLKQPDFCEKMDKLVDIFIKL